MPELLSAPQPFLVPWLDSQNNATIALNGIIRAPPIFSGFGNMLGPRKGAGGGVGRGQSFLWLRTG